MTRVALQEYCDEARELINEHKYAEAVAICRHILKRYPRHIRTYQILGEACLENKEIPEAIDTFNRLLDNADPENFSAYAGLGVAYEEKGRLAEAIWYMERAFELLPNNEDTRNTLRRLYRQRDGVEPDRIRHSKAALARLYTRGGQYRQAIEELRRLLDLEEHRDRMDLKVSLVEALWRDGRREQAAELARQVLQTAPDCLKVTLILGKIALEKGRPEEAPAILDNARSLDPENRLAQALFGETSPLPPATVLIPRLELPIEAPVASPEAAEAVVEPVPAVVEEESAPVVGELAIEETSLEVAAVAPGVEEVTPAAAPEAMLAEEVPPAAVEEVAVTPAVSAEEPPAALAVPAAPSLPEPAAVLEEATPEERPVAAVEPVAAIAAIAEAAAPKKRRGRRAAAQETALEAVAGASTGPLSDMERYQLLLEQKPKDEDLRLALARAYRDGAQMKLAIEQYGMLVRAKRKLLPEVIADVEGIVASRPDNLDAHELLADLYGKYGQLQKALERYRWVLERLREAEKGN